MQVLYNLVGECFHKSYNIQIRGELADNMRNEKEKSKHVMSMGKR
jgi:hypothetical protein